MTLGLVVNLFFYNLVQLIEANAKLEEELEEFEGTFKRNEILKIQFII
jgi:hypothetical protein